MGAFFYILNLYVKTAWTVLVGNRIQTNRLIKKLKRFTATHGHVISDKTIKRIHYSTKLSSLTNLWFSTLRNKKCSLQETKMGLYLGALTPIADDLSDELNLSSAEIIEQASTLNTDSTTDALVLYYLKQKADKHASEAMMKALSLIMDAQNASIKQHFANKIGEEDLAQITKNKGGSSTYFYRTILYNPLKTNEKEAIYTLGYALQLTNDMFDIYKDFVNEQQTLFTNTKNIETALKKYDAVLNQAITQFCKLDYPTKSIESFLNYTTMVFARGKVCAEMLDKLNVKTQNWSIPDFTRKELICDMEKIPNIFLSIKYSIALSKQIKRVLHSKSNNANPLN